MKRLLIASLLGAFAFAASAHQDIPQTEAGSDVGAEVEADATVADLDVDLDTEAKVQKDADRNCMRYTGSRIPARSAKGKGCVMANGRVYSRSDLERTGEVDMAEALRKLDPAVY